MRRHGSSGSWACTELPTATAIIGDTGINAVVPPGFWDNIRDHMKQRFSENLFTEGLTEGIIMAGEQLKEHFPYAKDDINELTDTISFDTNEPGV
jgi:uncharacterized membrane protein